MKKGFTLIELLAVITILGIISTIATVAVKNIIDVSKKKTFITSVQNIINAGNLYYSVKDMQGDINEDLTFTFPNDADKLDLNGKLPENGSMVINKNGDIALAIYNNKYCITKKFYDKNITVVENFNSCKLQTIYVDPILNGADPVLKNGMIPVNISSNGIVTKADRNLEWYNYSNKQWANAVLIDYDSRQTYQEMDAGKTILESDILAYFVWIPRYKYKLWYVEAQDGGNDALDTSKVHSIDIVFEDKYTNKSNGTCNGTNENPTNGCYLTHPSFTFGNDELNGIWVGKFETGYNGAKTSDEAKKNVIDPSKIIIKPNVYSWRYMKVSNMFYNSLGMNSDETVFGLTIDSDTHMMKNTDWGAVTYLTFSDYGKDSEVYKNNNNTLLTGCGADSLYGAADKTCLNAFGSKNNDIYNQSTTGNISGIFDMSGGAFEYLMGYTTGATNAYGSSQFTASTFPESKYVDIYSSTNDTDYSKRILGDATGELGPFTNYDNSWYQGRANIPNSSYPWVARSGVYSDTDSGLAFFYMGNGTWNGSGSFRIVLT